MDDVTFMGYDRDGDSVWYYRGSGRMLSGQADRKLAYRLFLRGDGLHVAEFMEKFGPIKEKP